MKKIASLVLGLLLVSICTAPAGTSEADQKWLGAVQTMVQEGKNKVTTPNETRANLLKEWASAKGYKVSMKKDTTGFVIEVSKNEVAVNR